MKNDENKRDTIVSKAAEQGNPVAQFDLGVMYANGKGVVQNYVEAYKWLTLAALRGKQDAVYFQDLLKRKMSVQQIIEAEKLVKEFKREINPVVPICYPNPNFFSFEGRINRAKYFGTMFVIGAVASFMITIWPSVAAITAILATLAAFFPTVKRLHDINRPGGWLLLMLVPVLNLVLGLVLLFRIGTTGSNQYGSDPLSKNKEK